VSSYGYLCRPTTIWTPVVRVLVRKEAFLKFCGGSCLKRHVLVVSREVVVLKPLEETHRLAEARVEKRDLLRMTVCVLVVC